jgi:hypothetical protein
VGIETLAVIGDRLPPRAMGLVSEWASSHQDELAVAWHRADSLYLPGTIDPLP